MALSIPPVGSPAWPEYGTVVRLVRYDTGNVLMGTQASPNFSVTGMVVSSPLHGSAYLFIRTQRDLSDYISPHLQTRMADDGLVKITAHTIQVPREAFWRWAVEPTDPTDTARAVDHLAPALVAVSVLDCGHWLRETHPVRAEVACQQGHNGIDSVPTRVLAVVAVPEEMMAGV